MLPGVPVEITSNPSLSFSKESANRPPAPPLAEQIRIVAQVERRLSIVEELSAQVTANLQRATRLRQSALQWAFRAQST